MPTCGMTFWQRQATHDTDMPPSNSPVPLSMKLFAHGQDAPQQAGKAMPHWRAHFRSLKAAAQHPSWRSAILAVPSEESRHASAPCNRHVPSQRSSLIFLIPLLSHHQGCTCAAGMRETTHHLHLVSQSPTARHVPGCMPCSRRTQLTPGALQHRCTNPPTPPQTAPASAPRRSLTLAMQQWRTWTAPSRRGWALASPARCSVMQRTEACTSWPSPALLRHHGPAMPSRCSQCPCCCAGTASHCTRQHGCRSDGAVEDLFLLFFFTTGGPVLAVTGLCLSPGSPVTANSLSAVVLRKLTAVMRALLSQHIQPLQSACTKHLWCAVSGDPQARGAIAHPGHDSSSGC